MLYKFIIICLWFVVYYIPGSTQRDNFLSESFDANNNQTRQARWFPFYTIGRFQNTPCEAKNKLLGTCVLNGECRSSGGISAGSCTSITRQAVCCIYQQSCDATTSDNNTYFVNPNYPGLWNGASQSCSLTIEPMESVCQLRLEFLDLALAPPNGDGICSTDVISVSGGASRVPLLCGENAGQHIIVDFLGTNAITISIKATASYTLGRHWNIRASQINCNSEYKAPSGCLQYYPNPTGVIRSFNYGASPNSMLNSIGVEGSRQIANLNYGICIGTQPASCSITYSRLASDTYSFTLTGDVGAVDPTMLGTAALQQQTCTTDYIIIPNPSQTGVPLPSGIDRFCGLGLIPTTSNVMPFVVYVVTDANEAMDIGNRGFALAYAQNVCPIVSP